MFHESDEVSDDEIFQDVAQFEVPDDDSSNSLIANMHEMLVNITKGTKQSGKKTIPLKSALHEAHPARLLSDKKIVVYGHKNGDYVPIGSMNAHMH